MREGYQGWSAGRVHVARMKTAVRRRRWYQPTTYVGETMAFGEKLGTKHTISSFSLELQYLVRNLIERGSCCTDLAGSIDEKKNTMWCMTARISTRHRAA